MVYSTPCICAEQEVLEDSWKSTSVIAKLRVPRPNGSEPTRVRLIGILPDVFFTVFNCWLLISSHNASSTVFWYLGSKLQIISNLVVFLTKTPKFVPNPNRWAPIGVQYLSFFTSFLHSLFPGFFPYIHHNFQNITIHALARNKLQISSFFHANTNVTSP